MVKITSLKSNRFVTNEIQISWEVSGTEYDWYRIDYKYEGQQNWTNIIDYLDKSTREYTWYPPATEGKIFIKVSGFIKGNKQNILIVDEDITLLFVPDRIDETSNVLLGNYSVLSNEKGLTYGIYDEKNKSILAIAKDEKRYKINEDTIISLTSKDDIINEFISKTKNKEFSFIPPLELEYNPTYLSFIDNSGIEFHRIDFDKCYWDNPPDEVKKLSNQFIIRSIDKVKDNNLLVSFHTKDNFHSVTTDKNGKYETPYVFIPGKVNISLGKFIDSISSDNVKDFLYYYYDTSEGSWQGIKETDAQLYFNPKDYYSGVCIEDKDLKVDFVLHKESKKFNVDYGNIIVKTLRRATRDCLSGVPVFVNDYFSNTNVLGISTFEVPVGNYNVSILSSGLGYERWQFVPATSSITVESGQTVEVLSYGEPYYSISGKVENQYGNSLPESVTIEIKDNWTSEVSYVGTDHIYNTGYKFSNGEYTISCLYKPSYPTSYSIRIEDSDVSDINFVVPTCRVSGIVFELDGNGIEKADVNVYKGHIDEPKVSYEKDKMIVDRGSPFYTVKTNSSGIFFADLFAGDYTLRATKRDYNLNNIIEWIKELLGLTEESELIMLLRMYLEEASEEEQQQLAKEIVEILEEYGLGSEIVGTLSLGEGLVDYYFQPTQRYITLSNKDIGSQDFFREKTYSITGKFIDGYDYNNGVSGVDFVVLTNNERLLYTQSYYRINGVKFFDNKYGIVGETKSNPSGNYYLTNLLPANYIIAPLKIKEELVYNKEKDEWEWNPIYDTFDSKRSAFNYGYIFEPEFQASRITNASKSGINFYGYTGIISGIVLDVSGVGIPGVKIEAIGGEYIEEWIEDEESEEGGYWVKVAKQVYTDTNGVGIFTLQKPDELYQLHFFKQTKYNDFYYYSPNDVKKRTKINNPNFICYTTGIEFTHNFITGKVVDISGIPIQTEVIATDGPEENINIVLDEKSKKNYYFSGVVDENGFYTIETKLPGSYNIYPRSYGYKYTPTNYIISNIDTDNKSGLDFIAEVITTEEGQITSGIAPEYDLSYFITGKVYDVWNKEGISGIIITAVQKEDTSKIFTTETESGGTFKLEPDERGIYYVYSDDKNKSYLIYPKVPYVVNLYVNHKSGIDFGLIKKHKIYGEVKYDNNEPIADLPILFNQAYSKVSIIDRSGIELFSYDKDLYKPIAKKYSFVEDSIVIANEGKHNLFILSGNDIVWSVGDFTSGNSIPGRPDFNNINYPVDLEVYYNKDMKVLNYITKSGITINLDNNKKDIFVYDNNKLIFDKYSLSMLFYNKNFTVYSDTSDIFNDYIIPDENNARVEPTLVGNKFMGRTNENKVFDIPMLDNKKMVCFDIHDYTDTIEDEDIGSLDLKDFTFILRNKYRFVKDKDDFVLE